MVDVVAALSIVVSALAFPRRLKWQNFIPALRLFLNFPPGGSTCMVSAHELHQRVILSSAVHSHDLLVSGYSK